MQRIVIPAIVGTLMAITAAPAWSQQLQQPQPLVSPPAALHKGIGPELAQPQVTPPPVVPSSPDQRPQSSSPIKSVGPAQMVPIQPARQQSEPEQANPPKQVLDAAGKPVPGLIQVSPNRAYDPATGRYYWTTPSTR